MSGSRGKNREGLIPGSRVFLCPDGGNTTLYERAVPREGEQERILEMGEKSERECRTNLTGGMAFKRGGEREGQKENPSTKGQIGSVGA